MGRLRRYLEKKNFRKGMEKLDQDFADEFELVVSELSEMEANYKRLVDEYGPTFEPVEKLVKFDEMVAKLNYLKKDIMSYGKCNAWMLKTFIVSFEYVKDRFDELKGD